MKSQKYQLPMRKPRPFSIKPIYTDEHRDRLELVEQRARSELGLPDGPQRSASLRGTFAASQHLRKDAAFSFSLPMLLSVVLLVVATLLLLVFTS